MWILWNFQSVLRMQNDDDDESDYDNNDDDLFNAFRKSC